MEIEENLMSDYNGLNCSAVVNNIDFVESTSPQNIVNHILTKNLSVADPTE